MIPISASEADGGSGCWESSRGGPLAAKPFATSAEAIAAAREARAARVRRGGTRRAKAGVAQARAQVVPEGFYADLLQQHPLGPVELVHASYELADLKW